MTVEKINGFYYFMYSSYGPAAGNFVIRKERHCDKRGSVPVDSMLFANLFFPYRLFK